MSWNATELSFSVALLGIGIALGSVFGPTASWGGMALVLVGLVVFLLRPRRPVLVGRPLRPTPVEEPGYRWTRDDGIDEEARPTLSGLGNRVVDILMLAERQAEDHRSEARRQAQQIIERARAEAAAIRTGTPLPTDLTAAGPFSSLPTAP